MKKRGVHTSAHIIFTYTVVSLLMVPAEYGRIFIFASSGPIL